MEPWKSAYRGPDGLREHIVDVEGVGAVNGSFGVKVALLEKTAARAASPSGLALFGAWQSSLDHGGCLRLLHVEIPSLSHGRPTPTSPAPAPAPCPLPAPAASVPNAVSQALSLRTPPHPTTQATQRDNVQIATSVTLHPQVWLPCTHQLDDYSRRARSMRKYPRQSRRRSGRRT